MARAASRRARRRRSHRGLVAQGPTASRARESIRARPHPVVTLSSAKTAWTENVAGAAPRMVNLRMVYLISAVFDEGGKVSSIRHTAKEALKLALEYWRNGYTNIRVTVNDETYTLEQFRMLVG